MLFIKHFVTDIKSIPVKYSWLILRLNSILLINNLSSKFHSEENWILLSKYFDSYKIYNTDDW